jgi:PncC family amidohydrolase
VKGTSNVFIGSIVCYDESVKINLLKVRPGILKKYTAESQEVTDILSKNLSRYFKTDIYASVTGLATANGSASKQKPVGTIFLSCIYKRRLFRQKSHFNGTPLQIRKQACDELYKLLTSIIED